MLCGRFVFFSKKFNDFNDVRLNVPIYENNNN